MRIDYNEVAQKEYLVRIITVHKLNIGFEQRRLITAVCVYLYKKIN